MAVKVPSSQGRALGSRAHAPLEQLLELGAAQDLQVGAQRADLRARTWVQERESGRLFRRVQALHGRVRASALQHKTARACMHAHQP